MYGNVTFSRESVHSFHQILKTMLGPPLGEQTRVPNWLWLHLLKYPLPLADSLQHTHPCVAIILDSINLIPFLNICIFCRQLSILPHLFE